MTEEVPAAPVKFTPEIAFGEWQANQTPHNLQRVVRSLDSVIKYKAGSGTDANPQMLHQGRLFAAQAIPKYDPSSGVKLSTFVQGHLKSLNRYRRETGGPVKVPERAQLDAWHLEKSRRDFMDRTGQEPDLDELADLSHISKKRIVEVNRITRPVASESQMVGGTSTSMSDHQDEALDYVYGDSDRVDRRIIELITGYGGHPPVSKKDAARILKVSPAQVTRRSERIGRKIQEIHDALDSTHF